MPTPIIKIVSSDSIHIGNIRPSLVSDIIVRILKLNNIKFNYNQNITDIDDKIIKKAYI